MMNYQVIEVFAAEDVHWKGVPLAEAIQACVRDRKVAARVLVFRAISGCYEDGEVASPRIEVLSFRMPLRIEIVLPASEAEEMLPVVQEMVSCGIVGVRNLSVAAHRAERQLIPRHLRVRSVMTHQPRSVTAGTSVADVVRMLLSADFNGVPVVDEEERPIGIITQGDLISRGGMPVRLGLLEQLDRQDLDAVLQRLSFRTAGEVMSHPVRTVVEDCLLTEAVDLMLSGHLKRLPVVDARGQLCGMLSRLDVFRTISASAPDLKALQSHRVQLGDLRQVRDVVRRDTHTVEAGAPLEEVMRVIDSSDLQRVAVVDGKGGFLGLISDDSLLRLFSGRPSGLFEKLVRRLSFSELGRRHGTATETAGAKTAGELMKTGLITIGEDAPIEEAIRIMTENGIKRLPVVDAEGRFLGLVSRDSLLRAGRSTR